MAHTGQFLKIFSSAEPGWDDFNSPYSAFDMFLDALELLSDLLTVHNSEWINYWYVSEQQCWSYMLQNIQIFLPYCYGHFFQILVIST